MAGDLTNAQWAVIAPLLPPPKERRRHRADDRRALNGILWVLRSGARWQDLPRGYGSDTTRHRRLQEWQAQGVWERIRTAFLSTLDERGLSGRELRPSKKGDGRRLWEEGQGEHGTSLDRWRWHPPGLQAHRGPGQ